MRFIPEVFGIPKMNDGSCREEKKILLGAFESSLTQNSVAAKLPKAYPDDELFERLIEDAYVSIIFGNKPGLLTTPHIDALLSIISESSQMQDTEANTPLVHMLFYAIRAMKRTLYSRVLYIEVLHDKIKDVVNEGDYSQTESFINSSNGVVDWVYGDCDTLHELVLLKTTDIKLTFNLVENSVLFVGRRGEQKILEFREVESLISDLPVEQFDILGTNTKNLLIKIIRFSMRVIDRNVLPS